MPRRASARRRPARSTLGRTGARVAGLLALAAAASGCGDRAAAREAWAIRDAVYRQQMRYWFAQPGRAGLVACLGTQDEGGSHGLGSSYLRRFGTEHAVRSLEDCDAKPEGAVELRTGKPAVLILTGRVQKKSPDEAAVEVFHYRTRTAAGRASYRVVRRGSEWVCLGPILPALPD